MEFEPITQPASQPVTESPSDDLQRVENQSNVGLEADEHSSFKDLDRIIIQKDVNVRLLCGLDEAWLGRMLN